jgi:hypothetical protein
MVFWWPASRHSARPAIEQITAMVKLPPRMEVPKLRNQFLSALLDLGIIGPYLDRLAGGRMTQFQAVPAFRSWCEPPTGRLPARPTGLARRSRPARLPLATSSSKHSLVRRQRVKTRTQRRGPRPFRRPPQRPRDAGRAWLDRSSQQPPRWREMDSNHRYPAEIFWLPVDPAA